MIETERLIIRNYSINDFDELCMMLSNPFIALYGSLNTMNSEDVSELINTNKDSEKNFVVALSDNRIIGTIGLNEDVVDINLSPIFWNKGYGFEALNAYLEYIKEELDIVKAKVLNTNNKGIHLVDKCGFILEENKIDVFKLLPDGSEVIDEYSIYSKKLR